MMHAKHDYAITFACYNALDFTKKCVDSLIKTGTPLERVVVIDNCSIDATRDYLSTLPLGGRIFNRGNLACGAAWNQGILHFQAEWTVIMNNDIIVPVGWIDALIDTAIEKGLKIVSPAMIEGALDYDFDTFAQKSSIKMQQVVRRQTQHLVCLCVHRSVFQEIGFFRATPKLLGFEDTIFFNDLRKSGLPTGIVGSAWIHHYGSITQTEMKKAMGKSEKDNLVTVNDRQLLNQGWIERKILKLQTKRQRAQRRADEFKTYGMTLHGERRNNGFVWL